MKTHMLAGIYRPKPLKCVEIPKPEGGTHVCWACPPILDHELVKRGHCFFRYDDECNIYLATERNGQPVLESIMDYVERKLNRTPGGQGTGGVQPPSATRS